MRQFKKTPMRDVFEHYQKVREINVSEGIPRLESTSYRKKEVAERARAAQIRREQKEEEWQ